VTNLGTDRLQLAHLAKETKTTLEVEMFDAVTDLRTSTARKSWRARKRITVTLPKLIEFKGGRPFGKQDFRCPGGRAAPAR
jgi:hypothetical protein